MAGYIRRRSKGKKGKIKSRSRKAKGGRTKLGRSRKRSTYRRR